MDISCSKDVSSSSKFRESFSESDESVYSETSSESDSHSSYSDEYYENDTSRDLSAAVDTQNQNDDQWIQIADQASDIIPTSIDFSPINTPGPVDCISKDSKPHEYFLHLFGEEFLDTAVADTNLYVERKITSKGTLGSSSQFRKWKPTNHEELLAFFRLTINMRLINKSNINAYWNTKEWSQSTPAFGAVFTRERFLMLHLMLHFPEKEGDTGKLKKVHNLVQHFSEQFRNYYVPKKC